MLLSSSLFYYDPIKEVEMIFIYGKYKLFPKLKAYKREWCNYCEGEKHAAYIRKFYIFHLFWIPILPLGLYKNWECSECKNDPTQRNRTSNGMLIIANILLVIFTLPLFLVKLPETDKNTFVIIKLVMVIGIIVLSWNIWKRLKEFPVIKMIEPYQNENCYYCNSLLEKIDKMYCKKCNIYRFDSKI
jgi:hypothetical protein